MVHFFAENILFYFKETTSFFNIPFFEPYKLEISAANVSAFNNWIKD